MTSPPSLHVVVADAQAWSLTSHLANILHSFCSIYYSLLMLGKHAIHVFFVLVEAEVGSMACASILSGGWLPGNFYKLQAGPYLS